MVIPGRTGGKRCLYRHTSCPGLTPTRHRSVGRQGAPSPRLVLCLDRENVAVVNKYLRGQTGGNGACMD